MEPLIEVTTLWIKDFYDGAISGICLYNAALHWFTVHQWEEGLTDDRFYSVHALTPEEADYEWKKNLAFVNYVGLHWVCGIKDYPKPQGSQHLFYSQYRNDVRDYSNNPIVGYASETVIRCARKELANATS